MILAPKKKGELFVCTRTVEENCISKEAFNITVRNHHSLQFERMILFFETDSEIISIQKVREEEERKKRKERKPVAVVRLRSAREVSSFESKCFCLEHD